jgi:hypothetical protein
LLFPNHPRPDAAYLELDELTGAKRRQWCDTWIRFLKQLLCVRGGRLVLKSPPHTFRLPHLLRIFPDARFVHLVRHPHDIYASSLRMWQAFAFAQGYQRPDPGLLPPTVLQLLERMHDRLEATRGLVPPEHWMDVPFERLIQEPLDLLRTLYARLDLGDTGPAETAWRAEIHRMRSYRAPTHSLPEQVRQAVDVHWQPYAERYGYNLGTHHA